MHLLGLEPGIKLNVAGADLGFLVWWGCRYNCARSARIFFATTPTFNEPRPLLIIISRPRVPSKAVGIELYHA